MTSTKVFLANPPWHRKGFYGVRAGSRWPHFELAESMYMPFPFFLTYAAALVEQHGYDVRVVDACATKEPYESFYTNAKAFAPDVVVLEVSTISIDNDLDVARTLRATLGPDCKLIFAGLHAFMYEPAFLEEFTFVDAVLMGEYEYTLLDVLEGLKHGKDISTIPGLVSRRNGKVIRNAKRNSLHDVDSLPWPMRKGLDMSLYHDTPGGIPTPSVQLWSSRGCPYSCIFCAWPQIMYGDNKYRVRRPDLVADEVASLIDTYGFRSFYFDDDTFNIGKPRILSLCDEFDKRGIRTPWAAMCRADLMDEEMLRRLAKSHLRAVKYGVESADQGVLDLTKKNLKIDKLQQAVHLTKDLGIACHLTFMFGLPGETYDSAMRTIELSLELSPFTLQYTIATPFPGSYYYNYLKQKNQLKSTDFSKYDGYHSAVVSTDALEHEQILDIVKEANRRWRKHVHYRVAETPSCEYDVELSFIVVNYNGEQVLGDCLSALTAQTHKNFEIIVVDNGSSDNSLAMIGENFPACRIVRLPANRGFSYGVNAGVREAKGKFIAVVNNDACLDRHWTETVLRTFERRQDVGIIASKIYYAHDETLINSAGDGILASGYAFQSGNFCESNSFYDRERVVLGGCGAALAIRTKLFHDIGYFDERFNMYLDDVDFCLRATLWGYCCLYVPEARARHIGSHTTGSFYNSTIVRHLARNNVNLIVKNFPRKVLQGNLPAIALHFAKQQTYHLLKSGYGKDYFLGVLGSLLDAPHMLRQRKKILGGKRISDGDMANRLRVAELEYNAFRSKRKPLSHLVGGRQL